MPNELVVLVVPREAAERLARAWEGADNCNTLTLLPILRDMFDGQDGYLHTINEALGREH